MEAFAMFLAAIPSLLLADDYQKLQKSSALKQTDYRYFVLFPPICFYIFLRSTVTKSSDEHLVQ